MIEIKQKERNQLLFQLLYVQQQKVFVLLDHNKHNPIDHVLINYLFQNLQLYNLKIFYKKQIKYNHFFKIDISVASY